MLACEVALRFLYALFSLNRPAFPVAAFDEQLVQYANCIVCLPNHFGVFTNCKHCLQSSTRTRRHQQGIGRRTPAVLYTQIESGGRDSPHRGTLYLSLPEQLLRLSP